MAPLDFVAVDLLGPLRKTGNANKYIFVITDRHSNLAKATKKTMVTWIAKTFMEQSVASFGILSTVLTDNGPEFTSKLFAALYKDLGIENVTTTEYHSQDSG